MDYIIDENKFKKIILNIVKKMEIDGLYRVSFSFPSKGTDYSIVVALFFDTVKSTSYLQEVKNSVEERLHSLLGVNFRVVVIPWSEALFHLSQPKNI